MRNDDYVDDERRDDGKGDDDLFEHLHLVPVLQNAFVVLHLRNCSSNLLWVVLRRHQVVHFPAYINTKAKGAVSKEEMYRSARPTNSMLLQKRFHGSTNNLNFDSVLGLVPAVPQLTIPVPRVPPPESPRIASLEGTTFHRTSRLGLRST
jgi:hypothetical protein